MITIKLVANGVQNVIRMEIVQNATSRWNGAQTIYRAKPYVVIHEIMLRAIIVTTMTLKINGSMKVN